MSTPNRWVSIRDDEGRVLEIGLDGSCEEWPALTSTAGPTFSLLPLSVVLSAGTYNLTEWN